MKIIAKPLKKELSPVWIDDDTEFGHTPLQAMHCGNIVIGKIPETIPEWMQDEEGIINNGFWTYNRETIPDVLAKVIASWMQDEIPSELTDSVDETVKKYTRKEWDIKLTSFIKGAVNERINEFKMIKDGEINNNNNMANK